MLSKFFIYPAVFALGLPPSVTHVNGKTRQQIGEVTFEGANAFTIKGLLAIAGVKPKKDFRPETIESIRDRIRNAYLERGFIKAEISVSKDSPAQQASGKKDSVNLKVTIYEGPRC
jgi:outer membrane protein assembly factor BamA